MHVCSMLCLIISTNADATCMSFLIYIGGTIFELFLAILVCDGVINYNHDPKIRNWDSTTEIKHNKKMARHVDCEPNLVLTLTTRRLTC